MPLLIHKRLRDLNMTQRALADAVGVSPGFISEMASGHKHPSMRTLHKLAEALQCTPAELQGGEPARSATGMSDPAAAYVTPSTDPPAAVDLIKRASPGREAFVASNAAPAFGVLRGDIFVAQLGAPPRSGDFVLATETDEHGAGTTFLARYIDGHLMHSDPARAPTPSQSGDRVAIMGVIVGLVRDYAVTAS